MKLCEADILDTCIVTNINAEGELRRRFLDLGIVKGTCIQVLYRSPFEDPTAYLVRGAVLAIRSEEGAMIEVAINN